MNNIDKTENLKNIRDKSEKITSEHHFCNGEDLIDCEFEENFEIGDLIDDNGKIYVNLIKSLMLDKISL